ncbi:5-formyltetrahydrofolate cyclo-ligase [Parashewanella spongiae]|uniref:5-formyltetrahydrofolate cyclo-ligase n=1 Tax=Parashewanella spongiae TaxID=342950 RepID=A0A3A6TQC9_9GAMM|nr:5-formyltetrahydrofolate cyclo-ligase [Parashewanella spongiae]MCL1079225.1 5-formyltetrahydrofolate cyclo-ligase [Parashewanella spongiae]RJY07878.1 5-formyltetrahydrofolate cyclo-ligase [Parashewanella spongiae]
MDRKSLRQSIRKQRNALTRQQQESFSFQGASRILDCLKNKQVKTVALYLSNDGELDTTPLIEKLWEKSIRVCLPVLHPFNKGQLLFLHYDGKSKMRYNKYGIAEPCLDIRNVIPVTELDVIITPLVAFDCHGNRMGMGGGYYDRTLANVDLVTTKVIGFAHDCQQISKVPIESWDVPLSTIVTPSTLHQFD